MLYILFYVVIYLNKEEILIKTKNFYHYMAIILSIIGFSFGIITYSFSPQLMFILWILAFILSIFIAGLGSIIKNLEAIQYFNRNILKPYKYINDLIIKNNIIICPECNSKNNINSVNCFLCSKKFISDD